MRLKIRKHRSKRKWFPEKFILMIICIFPFFPPQGLQYMIKVPFSLDMLYFMWRTIVGMMGIVLYLQNRKFHLSKGISGFALFSLAYALTACVTSIKIDYTFYFVLSVFGIACLIELWIKVYDTDLLKTVWVFLFVLFVINSIYMVISPEGVYQRYFETVQRVGYSVDLFERYSFIGGDNGFMTYGLPLWFTGMLLAKRNLINRKLFIVSVIIVNVDIFVIFSVTSIIGIVILDLLTFMMLKDRPVKLSWPKVVTIALIANIVVLGLSTTPFFLNLVERLFGKSLTMSIRTDVWKEVFRMFWKSPILGYGNADTWYNIHVGNRIYAPHNMFLTPLIQGGIIQGVCFIYLIRAIIKGREEARTYDDELIACSAMLGLFIMGTAETLMQTFGFWCFLAIVSGTKYLLPYKSKVDEMIFSSGMDQNDFAR